MPTSKVRVTQSLLSSFMWVFRKDDGYESFLKTLNREKTPPTEAMLDGIRFENCLNSVLNGEHLPEDHEWERPIAEMSDELWGAQQQVVLFADTKVDGMDILLHGVLDYLREGIIWDCKFSKRYELNKYHWTHTPQTSMYLALVPEARMFRYIICDGKYVYRETYPRDIVPPIEPTIHYFIDFLKQHDLMETWVEKWSVHE